MFRSKSNSSQILLMHTNYMIGCCGPGEHEGSVGFECRAEYEGDLSCRWKHGNGTDETCGWLNEVPGCASDAGWCPSHCLN
jgi:hypothetical protein